MPFAMIGFFVAMKIGLFEINILAKHPEIDAESRDILYLGNSVKLFSLVILCMVFARSAAMAFNRYLDRSFDARNPRTAIREVPAGILKANNVLLFTIIS